MAKRRDRRSPLSVVVLTLLAEKPMHPYQMQKLIKERGKDRVANVAQRNSVYQTIDQLERAGLIRQKGTARDKARPQRTVYQITSEGRSTVHAWLRAMLSEPARGFPEFPAALASMLLLHPADVRTCLEQRVIALEAEIAERETSSAGLPRVFVVEEEYLVAVARAELAWTRAVIRDLGSGKLSWSGEWLRSFKPPSSSDS
jgi:DNA-binding PadR family transcriptional regulator